MKNFSQLLFSFAINYLPLILRKNFRGEVALKIEGLFSKSCQAEIKDSTQKDD